MSVLKIRYLKFVIKLSMTVPLVYIEEILTL